VTAAAGAEDRPHLQCVACWHRMPQSAPAHPDACPECGFPRRVSEWVASTAPDTLAREEWHRATRRALWLAVTALAAALGLAVAQELERASGAFGGPALGSLGGVLRLVMDGTLVFTGFILVTGRVMPRSPLPAIFLIASFVTIGATLTDAATAVRGVILPTNAILPLVEQSAQAVASFAFVAVLLRLASWLRTRLAILVIALAAVALVPLAVVGLAKVLALIWWPDPTLDSPVRSFLQWVGRVRMTSPGWMTVARHAWEVPAIVGMAAILQALRGPWATRLAAIVSDRSQPRLASSSHARNASDHS
jgi:hypothetical protein